MPVHYKTRPGAKAPTIACGAHPLRIATHTEDPGKVTCFACRKTLTFREDQLGVVAPTPLPQRQMPVLLKDIIAEDHTLAALEEEARTKEFKLSNHRNHRNMYTIEELIHHGNYRSLRTVEVYDLTPATVDAVLISSAYCYGSWLNAEAPHTAHRRAALLELVQDLRHGRVNRSIGWSTFRLI